jgi:hypothetical protein
VARDARAVPARCHDPRVGSNPSTDRPSQRGETWNDSEAIDRHRLLTPAERVALAIEASRAALRFADGKRLPDDHDTVRP